jgi:hypothetical protein
LSAGITIVVWLNFRGKIFVMVRLYHRNVVNALSLPSQFSSRASCVVAYRCRSCIAKYWAFRCFELFALLPCGHCPTSYCLKPCPRVQVRRSLRDKLYIECSAVACGGSLQKKEQFLPTRDSKIQLAKMHRVTSSAPRRVDSSISCTSRVRIVRSNATSAPGFNSKSSSLVTMSSNWTKTSTLEKASSDAVDHYMKNAQVYLKRLQLPLGATLKPVDTASQPPKWQMQLPELRFVSIAIRYGVKCTLYLICVVFNAYWRPSLCCRPKADVHITTSPGKIDVTTYGASVEVSEKLKGLGLQDRCVSCNVMHLLQKQPNEMHAEFHTVQLGFPSCQHTTASRELNQSKAPRDERVWCIQCVRVCPCL